MTLVRDALTFQGITIGGGGADILVENIEGLGRPAVTSTSTPRALGGSWGGIDTIGEAAITAEAWIDADEGDEEAGFQALWSIDDAMDVRAQPDDEIPLAWAGLMWPPGEWCEYVRPRQCKWLTDEDGVHGGVPGISLAWAASDPTAYTLTAVQRLWATDDPVSSDSFEVANVGRLVRWARRSCALRMTAHGTLVNPWVQIEHDDGTFEKITFLTTMTGGQVLTVGADRVARVGSAIRSGTVRSLTELGITSKAPRWWLLHPSTGSDGHNQVTVGCASGTFSGYFETRGTR